jgi:hypothetical protein
MMQLLLKTLPRWARGKCDDGNLVCDAGGNHFDSNSSHGGVTSNSRRAANASHKHGHNATRLGSFLGPHLLSPFNP